LKKTIPTDRSSGMVMTGLPPEGTERVKALDALGAEPLGFGANCKHELAVLFYAANCPEASRAAAKLISATSGFAPVSVGGIDHAFTACGLRRWRKHLCARQQFRSGEASKNFAGGPSCGTTPR
jgi:predicted dinucleotide-binding enzyme